MSNEPFRPYVPERTSLKELTVRAVLLGLVMTVILGAANAYLGLRAGMTIAATYPAAIIGMAVLRLAKGSILEENIARTVGSIGESVAAGAIFTIPAFVMSHAWADFSSPMAYAKSSALMIVGGLLGIFFVTLLRRVMVEDRDLPFPESVAAAEIHKAGQKGMSAAKNLFQAMAVGAVVYLAGAAKIFTASRDFVIHVGEIGRSIVRLGVGAKATTIKAGGVATFAAPAISPAYLGVGYIIGPELGALNFAGGLLAWGLFVPLFMYLLGPEFFAAQQIPDPATGTIPAMDWETQVVLVWKFIVRPIAVGGMLVGAATTLYKMRKNLATGLGRAITDLKKSTAAQAPAKGEIGEGATYREPPGGKDKKQEGSPDQIGRHDRDLGMKLVFSGLLVVALLMVAVYFWFTGQIAAAVVATVVMVITGFFFAAVSGNLVGMIGSSNNPISGLTLSTLIIAALLMVLVGAKGMAGVAAVLGVAAVVCVSSAVAGEMLQDLKVGHLLGGTPAKMQVGDILGIFVSGAVMFFPLLLLHQANITAGGTGFGDKALSAPQAGLMAALSQGIVGGEMAWPLVVVGIVMGLAMVLVKVRSPMLMSVGMYLPLETTFAIFVGGIIRWLTDGIARRRGLNPAQKARTENAGVLVASGLIAGEALMGLLVAGYVFFTNKKFPGLAWGAADWLAPVVLVLLALLMIYRPLQSAGAADEPAPPTAVT
ncbi:MAG: oligopeptide transporter, OPT family [Deltaproteobacteria bacterium]|nr:oligopeptide transporter, OPT family [Deltaproteobacteria bacterium]